MNKNEKKQINKMWFDKISSNMQQRSKLLIGRETKKNFDWLKMMSHLAKQLSSIHPVL